MIRDTHVVPYGRPATELLVQSIEAAQAGAPLAPVTVVVPSNFAGLSLRRAIAGGRYGGSGLANVGFLTPFQVVEQLVPPELQGSRPLTNPVLGAAVRQALAARPGLFAEVATHPATEDAVVALYRELSQVSPATLDVLAGAGDVPAAAVALHRQVVARLGGFHGEPELAGAVAARADLASAAGHLGRLIWHLPQPASPTLDSFMGALVHAVDATVVVGLSGVDEADAAVVGLCERAGVRLPEPAAPIQPCIASTVISAPDSDEEVRAAVRQVIQWAEAGIDLDRIAIHYPRPDPYVRALQQHLAEAGVPANGPSRERLADSVAGRTLLTALDLPARRWRRDQVMALLASAPVRAGDDPVYPTSWDHISRVAGVVADLDDWSRKLSAHQHGLTDRIDRSDGDRVQRLVDERSDSEALAGFVAGLAVRVSAVSDAPTWQAKSDAARGLLTHLLGDEGRRRRWPEPEQDAAARVDDALVRLSMLDDIDPRPSPDVFVRALRSELQVGRSRVGRFGDGVAYGPLASAIGQDLDAVVVLGLAEGICPSPRRDDSLLPDAVRTHAPPGEMASRAGRLHDQHRELLAALGSAPGDARTLLHPRADLRGGEHLPSRWLLDTVSVLAGARIYSTDFAELGPPVVQVIASHAEAVRAASVPVSLIEHDARSLSNTVRAGGDLFDHPAVDDVLGRGLHCLLGRASHQFTEWDGNLAGVTPPVPSPTRDGPPLSATGLEQWASCGYRYYLSHVLGLRDRDEPERIREIDARHRGSAVHEALERFFGEVIQAGAPDPDTGWSPEQRRRLRDIANEVFDEYEAAGRTGRPILWRLEREQLLSVLDEVLTTDERLRATWRSRPRSVELPFGLDDAEPVVLDLPDGRAIRFRGMADRVDRTDDGRWIVLDYKTGRGAKYRDIADDPFLGGTTLQLGLYSEAARQRLGGDRAAAYYWMLEAGPGDDPIGYPWTDERRDRFLEVIDTMVTGIEAGVFPATPGEYNRFRDAHEACRFCDFDSVCSADRGIHAEAKVAAPELAIRQRLTPAADDPEDAQ